MDVSQGRNSSWRLLHGSTGRQSAAEKSGNRAPMSILPATLRCWACLTPGQCCDALQLGCQPDCKQFFLLHELAAMPLTWLQPHLQVKLRTYIGDICTLRAA